MKKKKGRRKIQERFRGLRKFIWSPACGAMGSCVAGARVWLAGLLGCRWVGGWWVAGLEIRYLGDALGCRWWGLSRGWCTSYVRIVEPPYCMVHTPLQCCDKRYTHDKYFIRIDLTMSSGTGITQRYQFLKDIPKQPRLGNCRLHVLSPGLCECPSVHLSICIYGLPMICTRYRYRYVFTY